MVWIEVYPESLLHEHMFFYNKRMFPNWKDFEFDNQRKVSYNCTLTKRAGCRFLSSKVKGYRVSVLGWQTSMFKFRSLIVSISQAAFRIHRSLKCCIVWTTNQNFWKFFEIKQAVVYERKDLSAKLDHECKSKRLMPNWSVWRNLVLSFIRNVFHTLP